MTLVSSILIGLLLVVGLANGARRGGIKEGTALLGVLLGALLVEFWALRWAQTLSDRSGLRPNVAELSIALALLLGTALFSGYGSGLLYKRRAMKTNERVGGALLGLLNMGLLISFALRYTQRLSFNEIDPTQPVESWIRAGIVSRFMLNWLGYVLLGAALALGVVAIVTATLRLGRLAATPRPAPQPQKPKPQGAPAAGAPRPQAGLGGGGLGQGAAGRPPEGAVIGAPPKIPQGQQEAFLEKPRTGP